MRPNCTQNQLQLQYVFQGFTDVLFTCVYNCMSLLDEWSLMKGNNYHLPDVKSF